MRESDLEALRKRRAANVARRAKAAAANGRKAWSDQRRGAARARRLAEESARVDAIRRAGFAALDAAGADCVEFKS